MTRRLQLLAARMVVAHRTNGEPYPPAYNPFHPVHWHRSIPDASLKVRFTSA